MKQIDGQLDLFDLIGGTPLIPPEEQKKGVKGWIIEFSGLFLRENGFKEDWHGIRTVPIRFDMDTRKQRDGRWSQSASSIKGPAMGWCGGMKQVYRARPTWTECLKYAAEHSRKDDPKDVRYYDRTGDWSPIYSYEEGA